MVVQEKGVKLPPEVYDSACQALTDDYQCVREAALLLIKVGVKDLISLTNVKLQYLMLALFFLNFSLIEPFTTLRVRGPYVTLLFLNF